MAVSVSIDFQRKRVPGNECIGYSMQSSANGKIMTDLPLVSPTRPVSRSSTTPSPTGQGYGRKGGLLKRTLAKYRKVRRPSQGLCPVLESFVHPPVSRFARAQTSVFLQITLQPDLLDHHSQTATDHFHRPSNPSTPQNSTVTMPSETTVSGMPTHSDHPFGDILPRRWME